VIQYPRLYGAIGDIRDTDNLAVRHAIRINQQPTSLFPHFSAGCPSCRNLPNLSWLGTGTKYAGLHATWLGLSVTPPHTTTVLQPFFRDHPGEPVPED